MKNAKFISGFKRIAIAVIILASIAISEVIAKTATKVTVDDYTYTSNFLFYADNNVSSKRVEFWQRIDSSGKYNNLYCIRPGDSTGNSSYTEYDAYDLPKEIKDNLFSSEEDYTSFIWLAENSYVWNKTDKEERLDTLFKQMAKYYGDNHTYQEIKNAYLALDIELNEKIPVITVCDDNKNEFTKLDSTETFLRNIQQAVIWRFVQVKDENYHYWFANNSIIKYKSALLWKDIKNTEFARWLYDYLYNSALANKYSEPTYKNFDDSNYLLSISDDLAITNNKVGPFIVNNIGEFDTTYKINVNKNEKIYNEDYTIIDSKGNTLDTNTGNFNGEFYIQFKDGVLSNSNSIVDEIKIDADFNFRYKTEIKILWKTDGQPLVNVNSTEFIKTNTISTGNFDLHLNKIINAVYENNGTQYVESDINTDIIKSRKRTRIGNLNYGASTDTYLTHKKPVTVHTGDIVKYIITIDNEGTTDGYAQEITDYLPEGLEFIDIQNYTEGDAEYKFAKYNNDYAWNAEYDSEKGLIAVKTTYTENILLEKYEKNGIISSIEVPIYCKVTKSTSGILTNVAEITKSTSVENPYADRDSVTSNIALTADNIEDWQGNYEGDLESLSDVYKGSFEGIEDDDDFEKIKIEQNIDLALKKYIYQIDSEVVAKRLSAINTDKLYTEDDETTAYYNINKTPIEVEVGSKVIYRIEIFNEGTGAATASKITDYLPIGLEMVPTNESTVNTTYGWSLQGEDEDGRQVIYTNYLKDKELIAPFNSENNTLSSKYVDVECVVTDKANGRIVNIAEISEYYTSGGVLTQDKDSETNGEGKVVLPDDEESWKVYVGGGNIYIKGDHYILGQQDDDDFDSIKVNKIFDLSLRKFISNVEYRGKTVEIGEDRTPVLDNESLLELQKSGTAMYKHNKVAVNVKRNSIITYTIRVYNEGDIAGNAIKVRDYLPEGLEFIEGTPINTEYRWKIVEGSNGRIIETDSLTHKTIYPTMLENKENQPYYYDIKVQCKVSDNVEAGEILTNRAEITEYGYTNESSDFVEATEQAKADRDSVQNTLSKEGALKLSAWYEDTVKNPVTPDDYYPGEQDDDDFETVIIEEDKLYNFQILKIDRDTKEPISGVKFDVYKKISNDEYKEIPTNTTDSEGLTSVFNKEQVNTENTTTIKIKESNLNGALYEEIGSDIYVYINYDSENEQIKASFIENGDSLEQLVYTKKGRQVKLVLEVDNDTETPTIIITIPNIKSTTTYNLKLEKVDFTTQEKIMRTNNF